MLAVAAEAVLDFWFNSDIETQWFGPPDAAFDARLARRFAAIHARARAGGLAAWEADPQAALALVIVLDQFPRHMFRGTAQAFADDPAARAVADRALAAGHDLRLSAVERRFLYLPFMHSEDRADQERSCALYTALGDRASLRAAERHRAAIAAFGRFPERNAALGRVGSAEEERYLAAGGGP
jgi:uncharacterized protein (DUF924 family)